MANRKFLYETIEGGIVLADTPLAPTDTVDIQGAQVSNLKDPASAQDAATKAYVDAHTTSTQNVDVTRTVDAVGVAKGAAGYYSAADVVSAGDCSADVKCGVFGIALAAVAPNASGTFRKDGVVPGVLVGATPGTPYYLGTSGQPVLASALVSGNRVFRLGVAKNATDLEIAFLDGLPARIA